MMRYGGRTLGTVLLVTLPALSAEPPQDPPADRRPDPERSKRELRRIPEVEERIGKLGSDRPEERETAMRDLLKTGVAAVPQLKQALAATDDAEIRTRLELILSDLDPPDFSSFFEVRRQARAKSAAAQDDPEAPRPAVDAALRWLARHQDADGGWSAEHFDARCPGATCGGRGEKTYDVGVSALAVLAFLGAGFRHDSREEIPDPADPAAPIKPGVVVHSGLKGLLARQDSDGCVGGRGMKYLYSHAIATLALAEAYGMTRSEFLKIPSQKAADFLAASQNPGKAWRYSERCGDNDSSVTGWAVQALTLAQASGLRVPKGAFAGALDWFDEVTEENGYYMVGYNARSTGKVYVPGKNEDFDAHATMSAAGALARIFIQKRSSEPCRGAAILLGVDRPEWKAKAIDFYYWHLGSLALFQVDGPEGVLWKRWSSSAAHALVPNQKGEGCEAGSWDPSAERWGFAGGRVYATAINALTLETADRYPAISSFNWPARR